jgi:hypothetical protein
LAIALSSKHWCKDTGVKTLVIFCIFLIFFSSSESLPAVAGHGVAIALVFLNFLHFLKFFLIFFLAESLLLLPVMALAIALVFLIIITCLQTLRLPVIRWCDI